ncbi:serine threonine- kinase drkC [Chlorella sorokiniana]|uniref:Serine threonine-kinase drkC n=1 Tax=Chlorella sorokiniana TaxID=3076 RepID=A0A2P6TU67_CHLSO|nr:serine threonine- kinase drkC [Chlorella sorokiniana]|eukprot:PRW57603.1 serine threonine- kinase drkC [Chlorella sorokiniana]
MSLLLALVIALPPLLLLLGLGLGVAAARWWWARRAAALAAHQAAEDEEAAVQAAETISLATAVPSAVALPQGRKASEAKLPRCIHVVASSASLVPRATTASTEPGVPAVHLPAAAALVPPAAAAAAAEQAAAGTGSGRRGAAPRDGSPTGGPGRALATTGCDPLLAAEEQLRSLVGGSMGGSGSLSPGGPLGHHKAGSMDLGTLVRAGPSVISQVMEDWEARSTLYRLMSGMEQLGAPGSPVAPAALLSPAAALFSPAPGSAVGAGLPSMPPGEVHMDEIDLIECIGKGGYGCVYKASWRGAGVAVKYIKCPTDDSDSLGRAIREVVLSKKMSHPNVVQCYSWTVLTEPDNGRATPSYSGHASPREQSFTSRPGSSHRFKLFASRGSLELQRPGSPPPQGGTPDALRLNAVRRGLDMRFNAAAGVLRGGGSPTSLHRITERLGLEAEAAEPAASSARRGASTELIAELVAEAAEEHGMRPSQLPGCSSAACSAQELLAREDAELAAAKPSPLKLAHVAQPSSSSPGSSPGIQAVHGTPGSTSSPAVVAAPAGDGEESSLASPETWREAVSVEPPSLPSSPFASRLVQSQPLRHTTSGSGEAPGSRRRSSGSGAPPPQQSAPPARGVAAAGAPASQQPPVQQAQQQVAQQPAQAQVRPRQSSEEDEGEDVYARFSSYDEMVAHFRRLAAEGQQQQQQQDGQGEAAAGEQAGPSLPSGSGRLGSLPRGLNDQDFTVTAASSFSDVLSNNGFMLEGSSAELAVLSQPSSPRHQQQPRSGASSWFLPSAASSRPVSPRADSMRSAGRSPGSAGLQRLEELREEAAASADRLSLGSQDHSFNSEEGFGSPVKQRCGGVKDVFALEELQLAGQEALMVVVMEYCDLGSLRKALQRKAFRPSTKWPFQTTYRALLRTAQEIAKGMGYIHEFNIVHGDLKPGNVLLKTHKVDRRGYIAKVSDFGLSRPLDMEDTHTVMGSTLGTIAYAAPESFLLNKLKKPSDVYAFGIMLWEMFYCTDPYEGLIDGQICLGVSDGTLRPEFKDDCPEPYRRLAQRCWHQDPERRPTFEEVDRELVRIEMEFRLHRHRAASKRASSAHSAGEAGGGASQGGGSLPASRPGSPDVVPRAGGAAADQAAPS